MSSKSETAHKEQARNHIVKAQGLLHYMQYKQGDYPYQQGQYRKHIADAKRELKGIYPSGNVIFDELDLQTDVGLSAALGGLNLGDEPFVNFKRYKAETFEAETKNQLTEVELVVLISEDFFHAVPHQFAPIRLVFRNNIARKTMKLLGEQFVYDSSMFDGEWNMGEGGEELEHFIDWQATRHFGMSGRSMDDTQLANKWPSDRLPATVAFLQWNWAALWCKKATEEGLFDDYSFSREKEGYYHTFVGKAGFQNFDADNQITARNMIALHRIVAIKKLEIHKCNEPSEWEDYGPSNSQDFIKTLFVDEILGAGCDWGIVNTEVFG